MLNICFWNNNSPLQPLVERLQALLPDQGPVADAKRNPKLEKFRKAVNCYYDLYNNGLCNRASQFRTVFGFSAVSARYCDRRRKDWFNDALFVRTELVMYRIVLEAALEQLEMDELMAMDLRVTPITT